MKVVALLEEAKTESATFSTCTEAEIRLIAMSDTPKRERKQAELYKVAAPTHVAKQVTIQVKAHDHFIISSPANKFPGNFPRFLNWNLLTIHKMQLTEWKRNPTLGISILRERFGEDKSRR